MALGTVVTSESGTYALIVELPDEVKAGDHEVVAIAEVAGTALTETVPPIVTAPTDDQATPAPEPSESPAPEPSEPAPPEPSDPGQAPDEDDQLPNTGGPALPLLAIGLLVAGTAILSRGRSGRH